MKTIRILQLLLLAVNSPGIVAGEGGISFRLADDDNGIPGHRVVVGNDTVTISTLRFYISGIKITTASGSSLSDTTAHLIELSTTSEFNIPYSFTSVSPLSSIEFDLGIDSATNVAGVMGGDLDPTKGMYWTWQSGYINFKLEGTALNGREFEYHLGGYRNPFASIQHVQLSLRGDSACIRFSPQRFFQSLPTDLRTEIMSPGKDAQLISRLAARAFEPCSR